jgi:hypothetical protein
MEPHTTMCCDGVILPKYGNDTQCCGKTNYDPDVYFCCNNKVELGRKAGWECCNGVTKYNRLTQICCDNKVSTKGPNVQCCAGKLYDITVHLCCNNNLTPKYGIYTACCGNTAYNAAYYLGMKCCADREVYNDKYSICCKGRAVPKIMKTYAPCVN